MNPLIKKQENFLFIEKFLNEYGYTFGFNTILLNTGCFVKLTTDICFFKRLRNTILAYNLITLNYV